MSTAKHKVPVLPARPAYTVAHRSFETVAELEADLNADQNYLKHVFVVDEHEEYILKRLPYGAWAAYANDDSIGWNLQRLSFPVTAFRVYGGTLRVPMPGPSDHLR